MIPVDASQAVVARSLSLSAIYLPPYTAPPKAVHPATAVMVWSAHLPLVEVSSGHSLGSSNTERILLVAHGCPSRPIADRETLDPYLYRMAQSLRCGFRRGLVPPEAYLESLASPLQQHLARHYARRTRQRESGGLSEARLSRVLAFIDAHPYEPLRLAALAEIANLSSFHFGRMFKRSMGVSPAAFMVRRRVEIAAGLLEATTLSVEEISRRLGFRTQAHFCTAFKRVKSAAPSRYRRSAASELQAHRTRAAT